MPLDAQAMEIFDEILEYYNWPKHLDNSILDKLKDTKNFNTANYKSAVSCYMNWCKIIFPNMVDEEKDNYKLAFAQQTLNILHVHAPTHHIHKALSEC